MQKPGRLLLACALATALASATPLAAQVTPGDTDSDRELTITDAIRLLGWLNSNAAEEICVHAADVNGDGVVDINDVIHIINYMFNGGEEPQRSSIDPSDCYGEHSPLRFSLFHVVALSPTTAVVEWETPLATTGHVQFGQYPWFLTEEVHTEQETRKHRTVLRGLHPSTKYYVQAIAETLDRRIIESQITDFVTRTETYLAVRPDHPRLLLDAGLLADVRRRIAADPYVGSRFDGLARWSSSLLAGTDEQLTADPHFPLYVRAFAFAGLLSGDAQLRSRAVALALAAARGALGGDRTRDALESMAYVYDWLQDELSEENRAILRSEILRGCEQLDGAIRSDEFVLGAHSLRNERAVVFGALAVHGDDPAADRVLQRAATRFQHGYLPSLRYFAGRDGGHVHGWWYTAYDLQWTLSVFAAWTSATGENWLAREAAWLEPLVSWFAHGLREDGTFNRQGDSRVFGGLVWQHRLLGLLLAYHAASPHGMWLAERTRAGGELWHAYGIHDVLWHDSSRSAIHPGGPTKKLFDNAGVAMFRSSWEADATIASFRAEHLYALGHTHRDNCSFTLYHRGDLALDSGIYDSFGDEHHRNYYSRTIAHNTMTVFDPDEEFTLFGVTYANDGGQRWLNTGSDIPSAWPATIEDALTVESGYLSAGIGRFDAYDDLGYAFADGTTSYDPGKVLEYQRHFVWLDDLEGWDHPAVVVLDDVVAAQPEFRKAYLLHTQNRPLVEGSLVAAQERGGVLFQQTVLPRLAAIDLVGGPGMDFWVNGRNYPPAVSPRENEVPGAWRVEVSPPLPSASDLFLHVLFPADAGAGRPPTASALVTGSLTGLRLAGWTLLFATNDPPNAATYFNTMPESRHAIFGLLPLAGYEVKLPDATITVYASEAGTLRYFSRFAGFISVRRV